jgi:hypothetical protein
VPKQPTNLELDRVKAGRALFDAAGCAHCHGGPQWTVSRLFYTPSLEENGAAPTVRPATAPPLGKLREQTYSVPAHLLALNPVAQNSLRTDCPADTSCATLRAPPTQTADETSPSEAEKLLLLYGDPTKTPADAANDAAKAATNDQIRCALRSVATFPAFSSAMAGPGLAAGAGAAAWEVRQDMTTIAQGKDGFSVPSLYGLAVGAPYFHAGNARSLEELFDDNFSAHHQSILASFLSTQGPQRDEDIRNLIEFLLSIDDTTTTGAVPAEYDFCVRP